MSAVGISVILKLKTLLFFRMLNIAKLLNRKLLPNIVFVENDLLTVSPVDNISP